MLTLDRIGFNLCPIEATATCHNREIYKMIKLPAKQMTVDQCKEELSAIGYGDTRDYPKIYVNGMATNWAKNCRIAAIAYKAKWGRHPLTVELADQISWN
jgi:hypothetical protein